jgi:putative tryptophan/tyrosine transport system substrate-binding protein
MNRRQFNFLLWSALSLTLVEQRRALAQTARIPVIGYIGLASAAGDRPFLEALRKGLRETGRIEGQNIRIVERHANGDVGKAPAIIEELVALKVDVLIAPGPAAPRCCRSSLCNCRRGGQGFRKAPDSTGPAAI